ncbi:diguanylate cyclase [Metasolibacillus meyeri]|uniref:diguanylate cyclase n=1 Tax=Metasolibacillus meyeri TaxID=1071052 RepID=UPI000D2FF4E3|nr:diguanylate cyclase [Metasolibacillus meyeri]
MTYQAKTQWLVFFLSACLFIPMLFISNEGWLRGIYAVLLLLLLVFMWVRYTLVLQEDTVTYTIQLFGLTLYKKRVQAKDIVRVTFKRFNWATRLAVIKTSNGLPIRVALFKPEVVFQDLVTFCDEYDIAYTKTKDYRILEKMG